MAVFKRLVAEGAVAPRRAYPSDVTDAQWAVLEPLLRERDTAGPGRPATVPLREIVNALLYLKQTGCPWRYLPHDLPPRSTVHYYFERWTADGTLAGRPGPGVARSRSSGSSRAHWASVRSLGYAGRRAAAVSGTSR